MLRNFFSRQPFQTIRSHAAGLVAIVVALTVPMLIMGNVFGQITEEREVRLPFIVDGTGEQPTAVDDSYITLEETLLEVIAANGVLANDIQPGQDPLSAVLVDDVEHGALTLNDDGSFEYMPDTAFTGQDSFTYIAVAGGVQSDVATVMIEVRANVSVPVAVDDSYETAENEQLVVDTANGVLANDSSPGGGALQALLVDDAATGQLNLNADGSFSYDPAPGFSGSDSFTYQASDGVSLSNVATVTLTVTATNAAPELVRAKMGFEKKVIGTDVLEVHSAIPGDYDRDGDIDVVATDYVNGRVVWYENDGNSNFTERVLDDDLAGAYPAHAGDVDGDGHTDVLAGGYLADTYTWYRNDGGGNFTRFVIDDQADGAHSIVTVDLDFDGDIDLVVADQDSAEIGWYENDGNQNWTRYTLDTTSGKAKRAEVADMDGDGDLDIVTASYQVDEIAWFENDGNQNFTKRKLNTKRNGAYYASPADIDGQGNLDILTASKLDNTIAWYRNLDAAGFEENIIDGMAEGARTVLDVDMDLDGDIDALASSREDDTVAWHENDGQGNFMMHIIDTANDGSYGVDYADVDFDGDIDVFAAARVAHEVVLYTNTPTHYVSVVRGRTLLIDSSVLLAVDDNDGPAELVYTLTETPAFGELRLDGAVLAAGGTFTQQAVNDGRVTYKHTGATRDPDRFTFVVADGGEGGVQPLKGLFLIEILRR